MTPKTPGVPLCELKGWPEPVQGVTTKPLDMTIPMQQANIEGKNQSLKDLGNKRLTVNYDKHLEAVCRAAHAIGLAYRYKCDKCTDGCSYCDGCGFILYPWVEPFANRLCTEIANCIHLSDGEGNDA